MDVMQLLLRTVPWQIQDFNSYEQFDRESGDSTPEGDAYFLIKLHGNF